MSRDLNDTLIFVKVVEKSSFTAAARELRLPKTTVSRKVQELELRLGVQLLHRTTRKLGLTEAGSVYFEHCQRIARELDEAESAVSQLQSGPRGWLRFTAPHSIGINWVAPLLGEFHVRHPEVRVEMLLTDERLDLIEKELDVALRLGPLPDSSLVARRLASFETRIYASPRYLERFGEPLHPEDLQHHRTLAMTKSRRGGRYLWPMANGEESGDYVVHPVLVSNDPAGLRGALLCGEGLTLATDITMKPHTQAGHVREVLSGWTGPRLDLNAVFPRGRTLSPKVRAFVDYLVERLDFSLEAPAAVCQYAASMHPKAWSLDLKQLEQAAPAAPKQKTNGEAPPAEEPVTVGADDDALEQCC